MNNYTSIKQLLKESRELSEDTLNQLIELSYPTLIKIAQGIRRHNIQPSATMDTVALVNETWMRLNQHGLNVQDEKHYYCLVAKMMRQLSINHARLYQADKRKATQVEHHDINELSVHSNNQAQWTIQLNQILSELEQQQPRMSDVFMLRYYLGLNMQETAKLLQVSERTVRRDWLTVKNIIKKLIQ